MIRLSLNPEKQWIDLPGGARVLVKPLDMPIYTAALTSARKATVATFPPVAEDEDDPDKEIRTATFSASFAVALGKYGIEQWEGIVDKDGNAAEVNEENIVALLRTPVIGSMFMEKYSSSTAAVIVEGNA